MIHDGIRQAPKREIAGIIVDIGRHPFSLSVFIRHQKAIPDCPSIRIPNHFQKSVAVHQFIVLIGIPDCIGTARKGQIDASLLYIFLWQQIEHGQPRFIGGQAYFHFTIRSFCGKRFCCKRELILHLAHLAFKSLWKTVPLSIHDTNMLRLFHLFQIFSKNLCTTQKEKHTLLSYYSRNGKAGKDAKMIPS